MLRQFALNLAVLATSLMLGALARAEDPQPQRGFFYFPPLKAAGSGYRPSYAVRSVVQQPARPQASATVRSAPVTASVAPAVQKGYAVVPRPVSWGVRYGVGTGYPATLFGQVTAPPTAQPMPAPMTQPRRPAYAQADYGPAPMYQGTPSTTPVTGYSSIYGYAGRFYGPYYGYGPSYYAYGGACGWGTPYNAGYYGSGCYMENACCRASVRYCTPFGGMFRGCGSGCYLPTPPPCPTTCAYVDPCGPFTGSRSSSPTPSVSRPPYDTPSPGPTNAAPPTPAPPDTDEPATPVEKAVTPDPQAGNFPRIPDLPPDA